MRALLSFGLVAAFACRPSPPSAPKAADPRAPSVTPKPAAQAQPAPRPLPAAPKQAAAGPRSTSNATVAAAGARALTSTVAVAAQREAAQRAGPRRASLQILATGDTGISVDQVGCSSRREGGLARRVAFLGATPADALRVDTGNLFFTGGRLPASTQAKARDRATLIATQLKRARVAAAAVGERDLVLGLDELRRLGKRAGLQLLAANLVDRAGRPVFPDYALVSRPGLQIGVVGLAPALSPKAVAWELYERSKLRLRPSTPALKVAAEAARAAGADLVIALLPTSVGEARELLLGLPTGLVQLGIAGGGQSAPQVVGERFGVVGVGGQGRGVTSLELDNPYGRGVVLQAGLQQRRSELRSLRARAEGWAKREGASAREIEAALRAQADAMDVVVARQAGPQTIRLRGAYHRLSTSAPEDPAAAAAVDRWRGPRPPRPVSQPEG